MKDSLKHDEIVIPELEKELGSKRYIYWSPEDEAVLEKYYHRVPVEKLSEHLKKTNNAVRGKAQALGITRRRNGR